MALPCHELCRLHPPHGASQAEDNDQWHQPPCQTELQPLPCCKLALSQSPHSSSPFLFSRSTLEMIKRQINTRAGLSCWRWRAVPPGRWTSMELQPAMEGSSSSHTSWGLQPLHCQVTDPAAAACLQELAVSQQELCRAWRRAAESEQTRGQAAAKPSSSVGQFGVFKFFYL